jgi:hypothetical protein
LVLLQQAPPSLRWLWLGVWLPQALAAAAPVLAAAAQHEPPPPWLPPRRAAAGGALQVRLTQQPAAPPPLLLLCLCALLLLPPGFSTGQRHLSSLQAGKGARAAAQVVAGVDKYQAQATPGGKRAQATVLPSCLLSAASSPPRSLPAWRPVTGCPPHPPTHPPQRIGHHQEGGAYIHQHSAPQREPPRRSRHQHRHLRGGEGGGGSGGVSSGGGVSGGCTCQFSQKIAYRNYRMDKFTAKGR